MEHAALKFFCDWCVENSAWRMHARSANEISYTEYPPTEFLIANQIDGPKIATMRKKIDPVRDESNMSPPPHYRALYLELATTWRIGHAKRGSGTLQSLVPLLVITE